MAGVVLPKIMICFSNRPSFPSIHDGLPFNNDLMTETFGVMNLLFYGIAIYEGYKFSFREITDEELKMNAS